MSALVVCRYCSSVMSCELSWYYHLVADACERFCRVWVALPFRIAKVVFSAWMQMHWLALLRQNRLEVCESLPLSIGAHIRW